MICVYRNGCRDTNDGIFGANFIASVKVKAAASESPAVNRELSKK